MKKWFLICGCLVALFLPFGAKPADCGPRTQPESVTASQLANLRLECSEWYIILNSAGYSDWWYAKFSPFHCPPSGNPHELLSGEWAAALYYHGIPNSGADPTAPAGTAVWLTDWFSCPNWATNSAFAEVVPPSDWDNPLNPASANPWHDTGMSRISNGQIQIQTDYEIADLGFIFASPMGTRAAPVFSSRYVLLQTYTITNLTAQTLDSLVFYQMLHGHPRDEYGPLVTSVYDPTLFPDPLAAYVPLNPVHTVGNFQYDITQWNRLAPGNPWIDFVGFSRVVEPSSFDNGLYTGHGAKPPAPGTHWDIESKVLNGSALSFGEAAGAEAWVLGSLAPGKSVSVTVALMHGAADCNHNGVSDDCDIYWGTSTDTNSNGRPDECDAAMVPAMSGGGVVALVLVLVLCVLFVLLRRRHREAICR